MKSDSMRGSITVVLLVLIAIAVGAYAVYSTDSMRNTAFSHTVYSIPVEEDITVEDVSDAMQSKASELNMPFVAHQQLSASLKKRGVEGPYVEIFQFCKPLDANKMVKYNFKFAAYMPCRIALVEDPNGKLWLIMLDLDLLIDHVPMSDDLLKMAVDISSMLKEIMNAGATGEF